MESANRAYAERGMVVYTDSYEDTLSTFKALIIVIAVTAVVTILSFSIWGV